MEVVRLLENKTGVSAFSTFAGFNVCGYAGAEPDEVSKSLTCLARFCGVSEEAIFIPRQVHSLRVGHPGENLDGVDALVTDEPGKVLCIHTADCLPLVMYDPVARVIGAAHCGWRGVAGGIAALTLEAMQALGAVPERIVGAIGPFICQQCFEVGPEVACQFPAGAVDLRTGGRPHVDLAAAVALQVPEVKLESPVGCSMHDSRFYSVRRQGRTLALRTLTAIYMPHIP